MVRVNGILALISLSALASLADVFGTSGEIKASHPEFFNPGCVSVVTSGVPHYVYSGRARILFKSSPAGAVKAREIARLQAENNLTRHLMKGRSSRAMTLRGSRLIAEEASDRWVTCVFAVPVDGVQVETPTNAPSCSARKAVDVGKAGDVGTAK